LELLKGSGEWRYFFRACCETSPFRLRSQAWQFREGLAELGYEYPDRGNPELEDALVGLHASSYHTVSPPGGMKSGPPRSAKTFWPGSPSVAPG